jgi:hypothetical protein
MYNPATQVQVPTDTNLGSYFQKTKITVGASPTAFPFKKKVTHLNRFQTLPDKENNLLSFSLLDISENHRKRPIYRKND